MAELPAIRLTREGNILRYVQSPYPNNPTYVLVVDGQFLQSSEVADLVKALLPFLTELDSLCLHEELSKGCEAEQCPCREDGVQKGYETPRQPLGV